MAAPTQDFAIHRENFIFTRFEPVEDTYIFERRLGSGTYGSVYEAKHRVTEVKRAIKRIPKHKIKKK
jgi:serine/threonine protein kinase